MTQHTSDPGRFERNLRGIAIALLLIGCLVVLWPFLSSILWAVVLSFTAWPIYQRILRATGGRRSWAALWMTLGTTVVLLLPFVLVGFSLADDVKRFTASAQQWIESGPTASSTTQPSNAPSSGIAAPEWLARVPLVGGYLSSTWTTFAGDSKALVAQLKQFIEPASAMLLKVSIIVGHGILELTLSILIAFFLYRDGEFVAERAAAGAERIGGESGRHLFELAGRTIRAVVYGILGTALAQGVLAGIGFLIARVPGAMMLALLTFFLSVLPFGPPLIWIPVSIYLFMKVSVAWGIFMVFWGLIISSADNIVKPWLISQGADMPFILIFFGVIGGAMSFGLVGVFLGPTLLAVSYKLLREWLVVQPKIVAPHMD